MRRSPLVLVTLLAATCTTAPVSVSFLDSTSDIVRFTVDNRSSLDVRAASFIVSHWSEDGEVVQVDTVIYSTTRNATGEIPFVRAGDETFFPLSIPAGAASASAIVLSVDFWDGSSWAPS